MPEGPEVRTVANTLKESLVGSKLGKLWHSEHKLRVLPDYASLQKLEQKTIDDVTCYGKVLFIHVEKKPAIVARLGMTGQLKVEAFAKTSEKHTHIRWPLSNKKYELRYVDPRRFGLVDICSDQARQQIIDKLGPDPFLMTEKDHAPLIKAMKRSSRVIKEVLLDQTVVAGVGNIYASEALFKAGISPLKRACDISEQSYQKLVIAIIDVLKQALKNCGTTFSNYVDGSGKKGDNLQFLQVFQRHGQKCLSCGHDILRIKQCGRSTFYCPKCQK